MKHPDPSARVRRARLQLEAAERDLARSAGSWLTRLRRHRSAIALVSGFVSGTALVLLPSRWWSRTGAAVGRTAAAAARSILTPMLIGTLLSQLRLSRGATDARDADPAAPHEPRPAAARPRDHHLH